MKTKLSNRFLRNLSAPLLAGAAIVCSMQSAQAANAVTWDYGNGTVNWADFSNWNPDAGPDLAGASFTFGAQGSSPLTLTNNIANQVVTGMTFSAGAPAWTLNNNAVTIGNGAGVTITNSSSNLQTINLPLNLANSMTFAGGASITLGGAIGQTGTFAEKAINNNLTAGTLTINGDISTSDGTGRLWRFTGNSGTAYNGTTIVNGVIKNGGAGAGEISSSPYNHALTTVLTAANTYTGKTTVDSGILKLDFSLGGTDNIINNVTNSSALFLSSGTLNITGGSGEINTQRFNGTTVTGSRSSAIRVTQNGATSVSITLGAIARATGSALDFTLPTSGDISTTTTLAVGTNNILASAAATNIAYASVDGTTWATNTAGTIGALVDGSYQTGDFTSATGDTDVTTSFTPTSLVTNTLRFNTASQVLTLDSSGTSTVTSGGILITPAGAGSSISGSGSAALKTGGGNEMVIINNAIGAGFTLNAPIVNNGTSAVTFAGNGITTLNGASTYSGITRLTGGGTYILGNKNAFGSGTANVEWRGSGFGGTGPGANVTLQSNTDLSGANKINNPFVIGTSTCFVSGSNNLELGGNILPDASRTFTNAITGGSVFTLSGNVYVGTSLTHGNLLTLNGSGTTTVSGVISNTSAVGTYTGAGGRLSVSGPLTTLSGLNTYTGTTTLTGGGILRVTTLADGGSPSSIGASSNAAANLLLAGNRLLYEGSGHSTDRLFDMAGSPTISSSGTGAVNFTNTGSYNVGTNAARTLTLTGYNTGANTLAGIIANPASGNAASQNGTWISGIRGISIAATTGFAINQPVIAASGIPANTVVTSITAAPTGITASANAGANITVSATAAIAVGMKITGTNIPADSYVTAIVNGTTITINNTPGAAPSGAMTFTAALGLSQATTANQLTNLTVTSPFTTNLTKTGEGSWTLSGANTYTGLTTVNGGRLTISYPDASPRNTGAVSISGGNLTISGASTPVTIPVLNLNNSSGSTGNLTLSGATLTVSTLVGGGNAGQVNQLFDFTDGGSSLTVSNLGAAIGTTNGILMGNSNRAAYLVKDSSGIVGFATLSGGTTGSLVRIADGALADLPTGTYNTTTNYKFITASGGSSITLGTGFIHNTTTVDTTAGTAIINSGTQLLNNGSGVAWLFRGGNDATINAASLTQVINSGTFLLDNFLSDSATLTINGSFAQGAVTTISGPGFTTYAGTGIGNANTNGFNINGGTLRVTTAQNWDQAFTATGISSATTGNAIAYASGGAPGASTITLASVTNPANVFPGMLVAGTGVPTGTLVTAVDTVNKIITLSQPLTLQAVGNYTFSNNGFLKVNGVLELAADMSTSGTADFSNSIVTAVGLNGISFYGDSGVSAFGGPRTFDFGGASAGLTWGANGFLVTPSTTNTDGNYRLKLSSSRSDSTVEIANPIALGTVQRIIEVANGSAASDARLKGVLSGAAVGITKTGAGTLELTAANTYSGTTLVSAGTLQLGDGTTDGSLASSSITNNGGLVYNLTGTQSYSGPITGTGTLTKSGAGTLTLAGTSATSYAGDTIINGGSLVLSGVTKNLADASTVRINGSGKLNIASGVIDTVNALYINNVLQPAGDYTNTNSAFTGLGTLRVTTGAAASDYATWDDGYAADLSNKNGDNDNDGLPNFEEYAFGLDPTSGSSVNPISQPLDKTTGIFKYKRRATPATTGVNYTYESSTTLNNDWASFTSSPAEATDGLSPVETITVTVPAALLTNPKLFIHVKASQP